MKQKLILNIKEKGLTVDIPGLIPFRTPAVVDVSRIPLNLLVTKLKQLNINNYELEAYRDKERIVYKNDIREVPLKKKKKDKDSNDDEYIKSLNQRFNRLENLFSRVLNHSIRTERNQEQEQIKNRLDRIEKLIIDLDNVKDVVYSTKDRTKVNPQIDELDEVFIPKIDTGGMKIKSSEHSELERDDDVDESADLLSSLTKKSKEDK